MNKCFPGFALSETKIQRTSMKKKSALLRWSINNESEFNCKSTLFECYTYRLNSGLHHDGSVDNAFFLFEVRFLFQYLALFH